MELSTTLTKFSCFISLPVELRLKIWHHSFHSRVLEFHTCARRYPGEPYDPVVWQSNCANHPALSVCIESRREALSHFAAGFPVATTVNKHRLLYLNPESDMVVTLGKVRKEHIVALLYNIKRCDPLNRTPKRVGLDLTTWISQLADFTFPDTLPFLTKVLLGELDELVLLMYGEFGPPANFWNGECVLETCRGWDPLWRVLSKVENRRTQGEWTVVDNLRMRIMNLAFVTRKGQKRTN